MGIRLTDRLVRSLSPPSTGNRITFDSEVTGFGARITAAGARSFVVQYRVGGRQRRITIGSYPDWPVGLARDRAKLLKRQADVGDDPMEARDRTRTAPTVQGLADRYLTEHAPKKRERSVREDKGLLRRHILPRIGHMRLEAVRSADLERLHQAITQDAPIRANRALSLLGMMFSLAVKWGLRTDNPVRSVARNREARRERFLTSDELQRLLAVLDKHPHQTGASAVRLLLLTGCRVGELLSADWSQFDLRAGIWVKPASATKQKKLHRIPLSAAAIEVLVGMRETAAGAALFPGRGRADRRRSTLKAFWVDVCQSAEIENLRVHDLRHSFASYLAGEGMSLPVIGSLLGHASPATTSRYAHLADAPLRDATERVGAIVVTAGRVAR
jgi:integrase